MTSKIFKQQVMPNIDEHISQWRQAQRFFSNHFLNHTVVFITITKDGLLMATPIIFTKQHLQHLLGLSYDFGAKKFLDDLSHHELDITKLEFSGIARLLKQSKDPIRSRKQYSRTVSKHHRKIYKHYQLKMRTIPSLPSLLNHCNVVFPDTIQKDGLIFHSTKGVALAFRKSTKNHQTQNVFISNLMLPFNRKQANYQNSQRVVAIVSLNKK